MASCFPWRWVAMTLVPARSALSSRSRDGGRDRLWLPRRLRLDSSSLPRRPPSPRSPSDTGRKSMTSRRPMVTPPRRPPTSHGSRERRRCSTSGSSGMVGRLERHRGGGPYTRVLGATRWRRGGFARGALGPPRSSRHRGLSRSVGGVGESDAGTGAGHWGARVCDLPEPQSRPERHFRRIGLASTADPCRRQKTRSACGLSSGRSDLPSGRSRRPPGFPFVDGPASKLGWAPGRAQESRAS